MKDLVSLEDILKEVPYDHKLAVTQWVMKHIVEHAKEGGSYRYLIYHRLGFDLDAYVPLCDDGLTISNEFDLNFKEQIVDIIKENGYDKLKSIAGLCDVQDCYKTASCGWPSDAGYRHTCYDHMENK
ncbi:hypothetical protein UFOVP247_213 [uncultured Caudovirales phage]|uniref:Uncharacterized protein n=1 Tax=uncultured Caudovirales phage TaxID=2100421 RepID=A0A6J7WU38_9CAUD|nr:hypothetical protein UFOVP247_213 [uncultured Caudovirales phage]